MKKVLAAIVVILIAAGASAPYVSGLIAEGEIRNNVQKINAMYKESAPGMSVEITRYDRGFTSSEVEWKLNLGAMSSLYGTQAWLFRDHIRHELSGVVAETSLSRNPQYQDFIKDKLGGKDPLHIVTRYALTGGLNSTISLDAFSLTVDNKTMHVKPARYTGTADKEMKHFTLDGAWEGVSVNNLGAIDTVRMKGDMTMESPLLWSGSVVMEAKSAQVEDPAEPFSLANLHIKYISTYDKTGNTLSGKVAYGADSLSVGAKKIEKAFVGLAINGINANAYEELARLYISAFNKIVTSAGANAQNPEQMEQAFEQQLGQIGMQLMGPAEKLLRKGLELHITDLHVTLPEGEITGNMRVGLNKDMTFAQFLPLANQPALALQIFSLQSTCNLPQPLLAGDPSLLQPLFPGMQTGVFVANGNRVEHNAVIKDDKLLLNGKEVQLQ